MKLNIAELSVKTLAAVGVKESTESSEIRFNGKGDEVLDLAKTNLWR